MAENNGSSNMRESGIIIAQLLVILILTATLVPLVSVGEAMTGGVGVKLLFLLRLPLVLAIATWFLRKRGLGWRDLGLARIGWRAFARAALIGLVITFGVNGIYAGAAHVLHLGKPDYSLFHKLHGNLGLYLFMAFPGAWGTAAIGEEMLFRGFVRDALERLLINFGHERYANWCAIVLQAIIFGALHFYQGLGGMLLTGLTGLSLGVVWMIAKRNLWPSILLHGLFDFSAFTVFYLFVVPV